ncbi:hypothetical protein Sjap_011816 [Stephania japonica]|uniref:Uncharacterized protein n=1 Tax=Stephania japonica TaxID=461633 RepID=A0AAP0JCB2_9MAGN
MASARKNIDMVRELVHYAPDVCLSTDSDGRTPLHLAAMKGRVEIMKELFQCRPEALDKVLSHGGETILHLCVKNNRLEALELLQQWVIIKLLLLSNTAHEVEVKVLNQNGLTALDVLAQRNVRDLKDMEITEE